MGRSSSLVKHLTSILLDKEIRIVKPNGNKKPRVIRRRKDVEWTKEHHLNYC